MDQADGPDQFLDRNILEQVAVGPGPKRFQDTFFPLQHGKHDDPDFRLPGLDSTGGFDSIHSLHHDIHQHQVGAKTLQCPLDLLAPGALPHHLHVVLHIDQLAESLANQGMIIHQQHPNLSGSIHPLPRQYGAALTERRVAVCMVLDHG